MSNEETPTLAVDAIIEQQGKDRRRSNKIALVERKYEPKGLALPGGMVEIGETVEDAVIREVQEEIGIELGEVRQWRVFSEPDRDPREHVVSVVFHAFTHEQELKAASDAKAADFYEREQFGADGGMVDKLVFDHAQIIQQFYSLDMGRT